MADTVTYQAPVGATVEWYTPPEVFDRLGLSFDLDPAAPAVGAEWVPAARRYAIDAGDNGLWLPWEGRVWLNPPYGEGAPAFVARMVAHGDGIALLPARTETRSWQAAAASAGVVAFVAERFHFVREDGYRARADHASVLMGWGAESVAAIRGADFGWTP